ncbi:DNA/RNA helicase domain-containing protein [Pseudoroseomonas wenyumeiae]
MRPQRGFGEDETNAAFLTGNAPLVAVLREALARDARARQGRRQPARQGRGFLQNVHRFLEAHAGHAAPPPEHLVVFDEAQRAWDAAQATRDTQRRQSVLSVSEPAHMLEIMSRLPGWAVIVALVGNGQEINTGEAGLAEWGHVIAASGGTWQAVAAPRVLDATEPTQQLACSPAPSWLKLEPALDLTVPIRSVRDTAGAAWVDAVLSDRPAAAAEIAASADLPFYVTRDLAAARAALRRMARGLRRAGLVCSSGARRLRADGLGHVLHGPDEAVRWFLDRWPDVRASDALEVCATEYACQGLELDLVGLAWGGDFIRGDAGWQARAFAGTRWNLVKKEEEKLFIRNTYRVLMTRARYETVLWVPPGRMPTAPAPPPNSMPLPPISSPAVRGRWRYGGMR